MSSSSPTGSASSGASITVNCSSRKAITTVEMKRARDRKSQQALRNRVKWKSDCLTSQVDELKMRLDDEIQNIAKLNQQLQTLEDENAHLVTLNATLRKSALIGFNNQGSLGDIHLDEWQISPNNTPASNLVDTILQGVLESRKDALRRSLQSASQANSILATSENPYKPNFCTLQNVELRGDDDIGNAVGDILQSYKEIDSLPRKVGIAYVISLFLLWQAQLDEYSWNRMPTWLRPTQAQLKIPHAAWIDRMPWPSMRDWLIAHPELALNEFAFSYNSNFQVCWDLNPSHVLVATDETSSHVVVNPIFEEHIRQLKNWDIGEKFRKRFPELARIVDESKDEILESLS